MMIAVRKSRIVCAVAAALTVIPAFHLARASKDLTVEEMKARLSSTNVPDRPPLCLKIAEKQLDEADKLYASLEAEKAQAALTDTVTYAELARDYAIQSRKHQKNTEIGVRKMVHKLNDIKHAVTHEEQAAVQDAINRLQRVSDDLLAAMFPKNPK
jgi:hypothetical protein